MFRDEFKERYTTIPFAISKTYCEGKAKEVIAHQHREIELISMTEGSADFYVDSLHYNIKKGDVLIIPPYAIHRARTLESEITSYLCICFDLKLLCDEALANGLEDNTLSAKHVISDKTPYAAHFQQYIEHAFLACEKSEAGWELSAMGNMFMLFGILKQNRCFTENLHDKNKKDFGKIAFNYITENFADSITSRTAANALFINESYFCRIFKKTFGCCFSEYILAYRLERAKIYLKNTNTSVSQIAFRVGFNSCSYFGKMFKEKYGISPLSYRKKHKA